MSMLLIVELIVRRVQGGREGDVEGLDSLGAGDELDLAWGGWAGRSPVARAGRVCLRSLP
eukprot:3560464-Prymnesium_polylepis.1